MGGCAGISELLLWFCVQSRDQHHSVRPHALIAAIVLAAGKSERMGSPKALLRFGGQTFLERILSTVEQSKIDTVRVVVGRHRDEIARAMPGLPFVFNPDYEQGMSTSIQAGIRALPPETEAAVLLLVDHPLVRPE